MTPKIHTRDNRAEWYIRRHVATAPWPQIRIGDMPFTNQIRVSVWRRPSLRWRIARWWSRLCGE